MTKIIPTVVISINSGTAEVICADLPVRVILVDYDQASAGDTVRLSSGDWVNITEERPEILPEHITEFTEAEGLDAQATE